jgi:hypothetical protein
MDFGQSVTILTAAEKLGVTLREDFFIPIAVKGVTAFPTTDRYIIKINLQCLDMLARLAFFR